MSGILLVAGIPNDTGEAGPHAYFDSLVARADHWLSYSLRDDEQLLTYRHSGSLPADVVYDASMDAAKATVREYLRQAHAELSADCDDTATTLSLTILISAGVFDTANRFLQIGDEVLQLDAVTPHPTQTTINVSRGQRGTTAAAHTAGDDVHVGSQSLENQERFPLATSDGHRYLFVWDSYWDDGFRAPRSGVEAYKMNQFESAATIWFEPRVRLAAFNGQVCDDEAFDDSQHVAVLDFRSYNILGGDADWSLTDGNHAGPDVTALGPLAPQAATFIVWPNRWTRHFVLIDQQANDYDAVTCWAADEEQEAVQLIDALPISVRTSGGNPNSIYKWYLEMNTSLDTFTSSGHTREVGLDLVSWWRNFVALIDPPEDLSPFLVKPV